MLRVRRPARAVEKTPERGRRQPRVLLPEGQVSVTLLVTTEVVRGEVSEKDFADWVQEAVRNHHRFRNGWVGLGATGGVSIPTVIVADDS